MPGNSPVLLSWCARNNDPFERDRDGNYQQRGGKPIWGPTPTILFDAASRYASRIKDVVLLYREEADKGKSRETEVVQQTIDFIQGKDPQIRCERHAWLATDPTDHSAIFQFLNQKLPEIRQKYRDRELVIHISPGTPSMQTIWVLMAECGFIEQPFTVVKSYRAGERSGREAVVPVDVGIETFYKAYRESKPAKLSSDIETIFWDPRQFRSRRLIELYREAQRFAQLRVPVLITGERGTGKTTLANWLRANSQFRKPDLDRNWASVPCGQYTPETMRSELFGYVKGAFTGADKDHEGLLRIADGDTLFLDEIGDISRDVQRLLIRALEEGYYYPLGSTKRAKSSFRLITATNIAVEELKKRLDADFLDRIRTLELYVPPLRELPEDVSWLWESTLEAAILRSGVPRSAIGLSATFHAAVVERLHKHPLDGNLRDLNRVAVRLIAGLCDGGNQIAPEDAVEYALRALEPVTSPVTLSHRVANAFSTGQSLEALLPSGARLPTKEVEHRVRQFMATELRRIARKRGVDVEQLCDVSSRTLRDWVTDEQTMEERRAANAS